MAFSFAEMALADRWEVTFSIIMLARRLMLSVDVGELEDLKYRYKGA